MIVLKSIVCGYLGAALGGLAIAPLGVWLSLSPDAVAAAAAPAGIVLGTLGLTWPWGRAALARARRR